MLGVEPLWGRQQTSLEVEGGGDCSALSYFPTHLIKATPLHFSAFI